MTTQPAPAGAGTPQFEIADGRNSRNSCWNSPLELLELRTLRQKLLCQQPCIYKYTCTYGLTTVKTKQLNIFVAKFDEQVRRKKGIINQLTAAELNSLKPGHTG